MSESLPLPLAPLEEFMLAEDRPAHPMHVVCRFRFSGHFDRAIAESAVKTAIARHPLLCASVRRASRRRLEWVAAEPSQPLVRWLPKPPDGRYPRLAAIDLYKGTGARLYFLEDEQSTDIVVQIHHACCDGRGTGRLLSDMCMAYFIGIGGLPRDLPLRRLRHERLRCRGRFGLTPRQILSVLGRQLWHSASVVRATRRRPVPLVRRPPPPADSPLPPNYPASLTRQLEIAESAPARRRSTWAFRPTRS